MKWALKQSSGIWYWYWNALRYYADGGNMIFPFPNILTKSDRQARRWNAILMARVSITLEFPFFRVRRRKEKKVYIYPRKTFRKILPRCWYYQKSIKSVSLTITFLILFIHRILDEKLYFSRMFLLFSRVKFNLCSDGNLCDKLMVVYLSLARAETKYICFESGTKERRIFGSSSLSIGRVFSPRKLGFLLFWRPGFLEACGALTFSNWFWLSLSL